MTEDEDEDDEGNAHRMKENHKKKVVKEDEENEDSTVTTRTRRPTQEKWNRAQRVAPHGLRGLFEGRRGITYNGLLILSSSNGLT